jgi:hypothetical protein
VRERDRRLYYGCIDTAINTLSDHAEKHGRGWTYFVRSRDSHGRVVTVAIVQVTVKHEKRR